MPSPLWNECTFENCNWSFSFEKKNHHGSSRADIDGGSKITFIIELKEVAKGIEICK